MHLSLVGKKHYSALLHYDMIELKSSCAEARAAAATAVMILHTSGFGKPSCRSRELIATKSSKQPA